MWLSYRILVVPLLLLVWCFVFRIYPKNQRSKGGGAHKMRISAKQNPTQQYTIYGKTYSIKLFPLQSNFNTANSFFPSGSGKHSDNFYASISHIAIMATAFVNHFWQKHKVVDGTAKKHNEISFRKVNRKPGLGIVATNSIDAMDRS